MTSFFSAEGGTIWIKFRRLLQNDKLTAVIWSKSKPDVEFQYGGRLGEFNGMSSQSQLPHCKVLPPGELNVMIPELRVTLQGAATLWIHYHDSRATRHIAGCSDLVKSMSWSCHIAGCKNSIRHIENRFSPYFIFFVFFKSSLGFDERWLSYRLRYTCYFNSVTRWEQAPDTRQTHGQTDTQTDRQTISKKYM